MRRYFRMENTICQIEHNIFHSWNRTNRNSSCRVVNNVFHSPNRTNRMNRQTCTGSLSLMRWIVRYKTLFVGSCKNFFVRPIEQIGRIELLFFPIESSWQYWTWMLNVFHKLGSIPTYLACPVVVLPCFACLVFRTIAKPFKATKTRGALNFIRRICRWKEDEGNWELIGPRPYRVNTIQNGRHVNKGKMHKITIRSGPCGIKMGSSRTRGW